MGRSINHLPAPLSSRLIQAATSFWCHPVVDSGLVLRSCNKLVPAKEPPTVKQSKLKTIISNTTRRSRNKVNAHVVSSSLTASLLFSFPLPFYSPVNFGCLLSRNQWTLNDVTGPFRPAVADVAIWVAKISFFCHCCNDSMAAAPDHRPISRSEIEKVEHLQNVTRTSHGPIDTNADACPVTRLHSVGHFTFELVGYPPVGSRSPPSVGPQPLICEGRCWLR